jgi:hypothetical protein
VLAAGGALAVTLTGCGQLAGSGAFQAVAPRSAHPVPVDNGVARLAPAQILVRAKAALLAARTVRISGSSRDGGEQVRVDMRVSRGRGAVGVLTVHGQPVQVLRLGRTVYYQAGAAFWRSVGNPAVAQLLTGKYVKVALSQSELADFGTFSDLDELAKGVLTPDGPVRKGRPATIRGARAIGLSDSTGTLYVATTGRPYPLQVAGGDRSSRGTFTLSEFGRPVALRTPPADQVIDPALLGG